MPSAVAEALRNLFEPDPQPPLFTERMSKYGDILRGLPGAAVGLATGIAGQSVGGLKGLTRLATGQGLDAAVKDVEDTSQQLTYTPREEGGREALAKVGAAIEPFSKDWEQYVADPAGEKAPLFGAVMAAVPQVLPGPKGVKAAVGAAAADAGTVAKAARTAAKAGKAAEGGAVAAEAAAAPVGAVARSADPATAAAGLTNDPAGAAMQAALRVIRIADDSGIHIGDRNAAFERARLAARERLNEGGTFDDARAAAHHVTFSRPEAATPYSTTPEAPTGHERLAARIAADREARGGEPLPANRPQPASVQAALREPIVNEPAPEAFSTPAVRGRPDAISVAERAMEGVSSSMETELRAQVLRAVRASISQGASFDQALTEGRRVARTPVTLNERAFQQAGLPASDTPIPGSTEALQRERMRAAALRGENTMAGFAAAADEPAPLLDRLQAARDAVAEHNANPSPESEARVHATAAELRRGDEAPQFRDEPNWTLEDQIHAAQRAYNAAPTPANLAHLRDVAGTLQQLDPHRADRFAAATQQAAKDAAASETPGAQLHARLQAVGDARRAYEANQTRGNAEALQTAEAALQQHRDNRALQRSEQRAAALRDDPNSTPAMHTAEQLNAAQLAHNANPTPETEAALQKAVDAFVREDTGRHVPGSTAAGIVDDAGGTDWVPEPLPREVAASMSGAERDAHENLLARQREHEQAGTLTPELQQAFERRRQRLREGMMPPHLVEAINRGDRSAVETATELRAAQRQAVLRHQGELPGTARRVDPGWEHQKLIPGLEPLTEAEGQAQAARRLGLKTRILRRGDPAMNRESVMAFYEGGRDNPEMFQYGVDPMRTGEVGRHASLEDYADVYGRRANDPIDITREGGDVDWDNIDVDPEPMRHGYGEAMRNRHGDYIEEKKTHEAGDVPVYDERGDPKKVTIGFTEDELPKKEKYVARGGEPMREGGRYGGDIKRRMIESEGGEVMRDEHGDIKYDADHDPDAYEQRRQDAYDNYESEEPDTIRMRTRKGGNLDVSDINSDEWGVYAGSNAKGKDASGALLYQTLLNYAANAGEKIGGSSLTDINALRVLSNANSNFARTGKNPRGLAGTASGDLPPIRPGAYRAHETFAEGPEIWRSESDEALKRAQGRGGKPERMAFDPELGFTLDGLPATPEQLKVEFPKLSPGVSGTGVGMKTLMRSAVFDWLRDATPEAAAKAAKEWGKKHGPLFGVAGISLQDVLREKDERDVQ